MSASLFRAELTGGTQALVFVELESAEDLFHATELIKASIGPVKALTHIGDVGAVIEVKHHRLTLGKPVRPAKPPVSEKNPQARERMA